MGIIKINLFDIIFIVIGILLLIQGVLAFIFYNTDSVKEALGKQETNRGKNSFFEFDFLANVTFFISGIGLGAIIQSFEWIIFRFIENKTVSLLIKAVIFLGIIFVIIVYIFIAVLPGGSEINVKNIDKIASENIRANQLVVALLGTIFSSILLDIFEIIEPREKFLKKIIKNAEKEDFPLPLGFGLVTVGVALFIQALSNIAMYYWLRRPSGTSWFGWTSGFILAIALFSIIGGGVLLVGGAA